MTSLKTALVLAGGGIMGFLYEVGVLTALDQSEKGVGWIGEQAMRLMRAKCQKSAIDTLRSTNPEVSLLRIEPRRDEMQLFMHNMMSFSAGPQLLAYGRECGRHFFADQGRDLFETIFPWILCEVEQQSDAGAGRS